MVDKKNLLVLDLPRHARYPHSPDRRLTHDRQAWCIPYSR